ncbi:hypothetical protein [Mucilaginibacter lappiensis]|uniref:DUF3945 domain-containing protein n=1 Tax=Mucilaginibacter lappiensis TaxID=354630 RepID=A0A841JJZ5_9SPHI|nr:hypothetical protein [Mucilaginibacter lappiensis]MBB6131499.1 hypothetical protein [Mucilaginibacter lappiensis]
MSTSKKKTAEAAQETVANVAVENTTARQAKPAGERLSNEEFLAKQLKYLGFGDAQQENVTKAIEESQGGMNVWLSMRGQFNTPIGTKDLVDYQLHFQKAADKPEYYLNSYTASLFKDDAKEAVSHEFKINQGKGVSYKEAYNLLDGRSVNKDLVLKSGPANVWLKMETDPEKIAEHPLKMFTEKYGFDLEKTVDKSTVKGLDNPQTKEEILKNLKKGNTVKAEFIYKDQEIKGFIIADPQFKKLDLLDENGKKLYVEREVKQENQTAQDTGVDR